MRASRDASSTPLERSRGGAGACSGARSAEDEDGGHGTVTGSAGTSRIRGQGGGGAPCRGGARVARRRQQSSRGRPSGAARCEHGQRRNPARKERARWTRGHRTWRSLVAEQEQTEGGQVTGRWQRRQGHGAERPRVQQREEATRGRLGASSCLRDRARGSHSSLAARAGEGDGDRERAW